MNRIHPIRRSLGLMAAPLLVFILARLVYLGGLQGFQLDIPRVAMKHALHLPVVHRVPAPGKASPSTVVTIRPSNSLKMTSSMREYQFLFSGHLTCGSQTCPRDVRISLISDHNESVDRVTQTALDGSFSVQIPLKEFARHPVDWRMQVPIADSLPVEVRGRTILAEEPYVDISRSISLPE